MAGGEDVHTVQTSGVPDRDVASNLSVRDR